MQPIDLALKAAGYLNISTSIIFLIKGLSIIIC